MRMVFFIAIFFITLSGCNNTMNNGIENDIETIMKDEKSILSSNPNDYIVNQRKAYNDILAKKEEALDYLTHKIRGSKDDGLREWIMAKVCNDILGEKNPANDWETGKEWIERYDQYHK